jgi:hypothetical protein
MIRAHRLADVSRHRPHLAVLVGYRNGYRDISHLYRRRDSIGGNHSTEYGTRQYKKGKGDAHGNLVWNLPIKSTGLRSMATKEM